VITVSGSLEVLLWLAVLERGSLYGCISCRSSTVWRHPVYGGVHPWCVESAMRRIGDLDGEPTVAAAPRVAGRRGAFSRRLGV